MQVEALEREYIPIQAALIAAGSDAAGLMTDARAALDRELQAGPELTVNARLRRRLEAV